MQGNEIELLEKIQKATDVTTKMNLFRDLIRETGYDPKIVETVVYSICLMHPEYNDNHKLLLVLTYDDAGEQVSKWSDQIKVKFPQHGTIDIRTFSDDGYFEIDENEYDGIFLSTNLNSSTIDHIMSQFEDEIFYLISDRCIFNVI